ncbi:MAG: DUF4389 domain-containing protein [Candidatus Micrarchaeia archaeon]|jgi:hypothetical protein
MDTVKLTVTSAEKASRLELLIRFVWGTIVAIILAIIGFFAIYLATPLQWLHILILGKRNGALAKFVSAWFKATTQLHAYFILLTDERPPLMPEF